MRRIDSSQVFCEGYLDLNSHTICEGSAKDLRRMWSPLRSFALPRAVLRGAARAVAPRRRTWRRRRTYQVVPSYLTQCHRVRRRAPSPRTRSLRAPSCEFSLRSSCLCRHASRRRWRPRASTRWARGCPHSSARGLTPPRSMTVPRSLREPPASLCARVVRGRSASASGAPSAHSHYFRKYENSLQNTTGKLSGIVRRQFEEGDILDCRLPA